MADEFLHSIGSSSEGMAPLHDQPRQGAVPLSGRRVSCDFAEKTSQSKAHVSDVAKKGFTSVTSEQEITPVSLEYSIKKTFGKDLGGLIFKIINVFSSLFESTQKPVSVPVESPGGLVGKLVEKRDLEGIKKLIFRQTPHTAIISYLPLLRTHYGEKDALNIMKEIIGDLPFEEMKKWNTFLRQEQKKMIQEELRAGGDFSQVENYKPFNQLRLACLNSVAKEGAKDTFNKKVLTKELLQSKLDHYKAQMVARFDQELKELKSPAEAIHELEKREKTPEVEERMNVLVDFLADRGALREETSRVAEQKERFLDECQRQTDELDRWSKGLSTSPEQQIQFNDVLERLFPE